MLSNTQQLISWGRGGGRRGLEANTDFCTGTNKCDFSYNGTINKV